MGSGLTDFEVLEFAESPRRFHARDIPVDPTPQIWVNAITSPALVLGSTQRPDGVVDVDACTAAGIDVVRRRSGGGAVLLLPGEVTWFDVIIPRGGSGWADDVHAPMVWLGRELATLLEPLVDGDVTVHDGALITTAFSRLLCFDGVGPGEVSVDGVKLVGISQRRTRRAARLQCCWYRTYRADRLVNLLAPACRPPVDALQPVATLGLAATAMF